MTTLEYRLHLKPTTTAIPRTAGPHPYPRPASRPAAAPRPAGASRPEPWCTNRASCRHGVLLHPQGDLAERTRQYQLKREAADAIPHTHLPIWRWRLIFLRGILPILWMFPRCRVEGCKRWPCKPLLARLHDRYGPGPEIDAQIKALSTKRRRAKAARRNPTAVSHRAEPKPRGRTRPRARTRCGSQ